MRLGYVQIRHKRQSGNAEADQLKREASCKRVYIEGYKDQKKDWKKRPKLRDLLVDSQPGDTLVIANLEQLSGHYQVWLDFLSELKNWNLELEIVTHPHNMLADWWYLFHWMQNQDLRKQPGIKIRKFNRKRNTERFQYSFFSRDTYFRRGYWEIFQQVMTKRSLQQIAKNSGAPLATVVRISKYYTKLKQIILLVATFLLTIISLKISQPYLTNGFLRMLIYVIITLLIIFFSYFDSQSD